MHVTSAAIAGLGEQRPQAERRHDCAQPLCDSCNSGLVCSGLASYGASDFPLTQVGLLGQIAQGSFRSP
jgi:hypothetical protein